MPTTGPPPLPQEFLLRDPKTGLDRYYKMEYKCYSMTRSQADAYIAQCCGGGPFRGGGGPNYMTLDRMLHAPSPPGIEVAFPLPAPPDHGMSPSMETEPF
jgi:hypothetical protein